MRALGAASDPFPALLDLGCGTGVAGAAWASEMKPPLRGLPAWIGTPGPLPKLDGRTGPFGLDGSAKSTGPEYVQASGRTAIVAAFILNELPEEARERWRGSML